jgi:RHS repeat-associated protein
MEKTIYDDKTFSSQEYDTLGRRVAAIDQNGLRTEYRYDDLGRLTGVKDALNQWTEYGYNEQGQLIYQEDARDRRTYYEYDALGRRSATVLPMNQRSGMTYDEVGNLKTMTDYNGHIITYIYDELNRLSEKQFQDGSKVQYGYTLNGLQDTVTFRNGAGLVTSFYNYDYDVRDRLVKRTDAIGGVERSIAYGYDIASNMTSVTTASGITTYSYDERNRLDLVKQNNVLQADYDYDAANRLIKTSFGNNTTETRVYDNLNRLKELTSQRGNVLLSKYVYSLDKVGNRKAATETVNGQGRAIAYTYDDLYRLTDEAIVDGVNGNRTSHYVYDAVGNRESKTVNGVTTAYVYDRNDRLLTEKVGTATTVSYTYDNNGSTLTKVENGVTTTYTWNDEKRMVSATVGSTTTAEYVYNDQGIRVASKVNGVETRYLLDEGIKANVWEEYALNGTVQTSYVYGNDLITQTQANQSSYYLVDGLGSTRLLMDAQGQVLNAYGYEAFGETVSQSGTASNKYQYAGEQFDGAIGDYYLRQRFYDISSGRFGRMDKFEERIGNLDNLNKYVYAYNNPVTRIDPTGLTTMLEQTEVRKEMDILEASYRLPAATRSTVVARNGLQNVAIHIFNALGRAAQISLSLARNYNRLFHVPIVFWGSDLLEATTHQLEAVTGHGQTSTNRTGEGFSIPISPALHRRATRHPDGWRYSQPQAAGRGSDQQLDEFPYGITEEGGKDRYDFGLVSIKNIDTTHNSRNGRWLQTFMNAAQVTNYQTDPRNSLFINLPIPSLGISFGLNRLGLPITIWSGYN